MESVYIKTHNRLIDDVIVTTVLPWVVGIAQVVMTNRYRMKSSVLRTGT